MGFENVDDMGICDDFVKEKWECSKFEPYFSNDNENFYNLSKLMPYFLARTKDQYIREKYLRFVGNEILREYIIEVDKELKFLEIQGTFDNPIILNGLYEIIYKYYKKFMKKYRV